MDVVKVEVVMSLVDSIEVVHVDLDVVRVEVVVVTLVDSVEVAHVDVQVVKVEGLVILVDNSVEDEFIIPGVVLPGTHLQMAK